ncbi:MAG: 3-oxoacyl-[acyl-carrier-protein] synthase III C-terminal domain-containing protein [Chloroflexota bacterium]
MAGIVSYGAYVPWWRLSRKAIAPGGSGEKAIANWDEDSVTMAVAAGMDCLSDADRNSIDGLYFASTTSPYKESQVSTLVATALDLREETRSADFSSSLRAGTSAVRAALDAVSAGSARRVLVAAADCRLGMPGSTFEQDCGDGAGVLVIGNSDVAAEVVASYSVNNEILDVWRADGDQFLRSWEDRFIITKGYLRSMSQAISGVLKQAKLTPKDITRAVLYTPDGRRVAELAKEAGFDPKAQVQDPLAAAMGNTGCAYALMLLVAALEDAKPGDTILWASYGNGSDAFVLRATDKIGQGKGRRAMKKHLASKRVLEDYRTYLQWRRLLPMDQPRRPVMGNISLSAAWRERKQNLAMYGGKCQVCGTVQYPQQRICVSCQTADKFDPVRLYDKKAQVFTYTADFLDPIETPQVTAVVDFEGGGRCLLAVTDRVPNEIKVGMPLEVSFRKVFFERGIHNYFWKATPVRA